MFRYVFLLSLCFTAGCTATRDRFCNLIDNESYFLVSAAGCETVQLSFEYDVKAKFSALEAYDWLPGQHPVSVDAGTHDEGYLHEWVTDAVDAKLAQRGLRLDGKAPDLLVSYEASGDGRGSLSLVFLLAETRKPVWRGTADDQAYPARNADAFEIRVRTAVGMLLEQFPPTSGGE